MNERTVLCPTCGAERSTKAAPRVRVTCPACGQLYRVPPPPAPALEPSAEAPPASAEPSTAADRPEPARRAGGGEPGPGADVPVTVTFEEPTGPVAGLAPATAIDGEPVPQLQRAPLDPPPQHPLTETGRVHGAKGGRATRGAAAYYLERTR